MRNAGLVNASARSSGLGRPNLYTVFMQKSRAFICLLPRAHVVSVEPTRRCSQHLALGSPWLADAVEVLASAAQKNWFHGSKICRFEYLWKVYRTSGQFQ